MSSQVKSHILEAAAALFAAEGYESVSIQRICQAARVSNGSFFHLYKAKQELAEALCRPIIKRYHEAIDAKITPGRPFDWQAVERLIDAHIHWTVENTEAAKFLYHVKPLLVGQGFAAFNRQLRQDTETALRSWVEASDARKKMRLWSAGELSALIFGPVRILCSDWLLDLGIRLHLPAADRLAEAAWGALTAKSAAEPDRANGRPSPVNDARAKGGDLFPVSNCDDG